jgi:type II secretory pathway pseudopilin PulG
MQPLILHPQRRRQQAFSLVEMLLVAAIMTVVIFGLYSMFDQTLKALRSNTTQVDILEGGRAAMELISRDLEQCRVSNYPETLNLMAYSTYPRAGYPGLIALALLTNVNQQYNIKWTNYLQDVFFLTQREDEWFASGYCVGLTSPPAQHQGPTNLNYVYRSTNGWGQLFAFSYSTGLDPALGMRRLNRQFVQNAVFCFKNETDSRTKASGYPWASELISFSPVIDGVVHFAIKPYDALGQPIDYWHPFLTNQYRPLVLSAGENMPSLFASTPVFFQTNVIVRQELGLPTQSQLYFLGNAAPAYLEIELALIEPKTLDQLKGFPNPDRQRRFLEQHPGQVHLFRKRITIRTATP